MAKLSDLIETFASALSVPQTTVESYVKVLRKDGLLTTGGRGRGAPNVTADDCAKVLVAIMAGSPTHAVEKLSSFGRLRGVVGDCDPEKMNHPILAALGVPGGRTFLEDITTLIKRSTEEDPSVIAFNAAKTIREIPNGSIHTFGSGEIVIEHENRTAFISFSAHWDFHVSGHKYMHDSQETFITYGLDDFGIPLIFDTRNLKTKTSVNLFAFSDIGQMLNK